MCLFFASCERYCHGFPEHLANYLPYKKGYTLSFVNQFNDTVSFRVNEIDMQKEHAIPKCGKCECKEPFFAVYADNLNCTISVGLELGEPYINFILDNLYFGDKISNNELPYSELRANIRNFKGKYNPQNGPIFGETVTLEGSSQISKVLIVWGIGVIEFYDQKHDFQWKSINK